MSLIISKMNKQIFLAHRGHWQTGATENTITAFNNTVNELSPKCHGFECDFRQVEEGDPSSWIIFHDEINKETKNRLDNEQLLTFDNNSFIPTLIQFKRWLATIHETVIVNIEIKYGTTDGIAHLIESINDTVKESPNINIIYSSFNQRIVQQIGKTSTFKPGLLITSKEDLDKWLAINLNNYELTFIAIEHLKLTSSILKIAKKNSLNIGVYYKTHIDYANEINNAINNKAISYVFFEA